MGLVAYYYTRLFRNLANFSTVSVYTLSMRHLIILFHFFFEYVAEAVGNRSHDVACETDLENDDMCMAVVKEKGTNNTPPPFGLQS